MLTGTCHCGKAGWTLAGDPGSITACNCTLCRRYGTLWAYGFEGENLAITGETRSYSRIDRKNPVLEILFCPSCAGVLAWRGLHLDDDGRRRMAVNIRHTEPDGVMHLAIDHFDGLSTFDDLPSQGRCVRDYWF
jgi:hypothetical protein